MGLYGKAVCDRCGAKKNKRFRISFISYLRKRGWKVTTGKVICPTCQKKYSEAAKKAWVTRKANERRAMAKKMWHGKKRPKRKIRVARGAK